MVTVRNSEVAKHSKGQYKMIEIHFLHSEEKDCSIMLYGHNGGLKKWINTDPCRQTCLSLLQLYRVLPHEGPPNLWIYSSQAAAVVRIEPFRTVMGRHGPLFLARGTQVTFSPPPPPWVGFLKDFHVKM